MASPFEIASSVEPLDPQAGTFRVRVPEGWQQGRGAFGGLVLGAMLRAMQRCEPEPSRAVRTLTGDIAGPLLAGEAEVRVVVVRRGSNQTNLRAEIVQGGALIAIASAVLSKPRPSMLGDVRPRVAKPPPAASLPRASLGPSGPVFTSHFDYRPVDASSYPFAGAAEAVTSGWVREATAPSVVDAPMLVALLDAWWPASLTTLSKPRPAATIAFTAEILVDPASLDPALPLFHVAHTAAEHDGFQVEMRALHDANGAVVAMNQQTFAVVA